MSIALERHRSALVGCAISAPAGAGLPDFAGWKDAAALHVHTEDTVETRWAVAGTAAITPSSHVFVRNNLPAPENGIVADPDRWTIRFEGVASPATLTAGELKALGTETVVAVLQCAGNGRALQAPVPEGTPWRDGAAANVRWTGVPLRRVVAALGGAASGLPFLTATGGDPLPDSGDRLDHLVERSVPREAAEVALLAVAMNDAPLPVAHGGPVRLVVPGYFAVNSVKYVERIAFTAEESRAAIQRTEYRMHGVGEAVRPERDPSLWRLLVKSWITEVEVAADGAVLVRGVAFGGGERVTAVELTADGGAAWRAAAFASPDLGPYAWRVFEARLCLPPGLHRVASRAHDAAGAVQPATAPANARGYGHSGWADHAVQVTVP